MLRRSILGFAMLALPACPADDAAADEGGTSTSGDTTAAESTATMSGASGPVTSTASETTNGSATATVDDTTGSTSTAGSTTTGGNGTSSSSTGAAEVTYPPCDTRMDPPCPEGYDSCFDTIPGFNICNVIDCETVDDCPLANGGTAEVLCAPFGGGTCVLDCPGGLECPEGMECVLIGGAGVERCLWPIDRP